MGILGAIHEFFCENSCTLPWEEASGSDGELFGGYIGWVKSQCVVG
jgi:hypothetical protein